MLGSPGGETGAMLRQIDVRNEGRYYHLPGGTAAQCEFDQTIILIEKKNIVVLKHLAFTYTLIQTVAYVTACIWSCTHSYVKDCT